MFPWNQNRFVATIKLMTDKTPRPKNEVTHALGRRLCELRQDFGITQQDLADLAHVDTTSISRIERGFGNPTLDLITRLAVALDTPVANLVSGITPDHLPRPAYKRFTARDFIESRMAHEAEERDDPREAQN